MTGKRPQIFNLDEEITPEILLALVGKEQLHRG